MAERDGRREGGAGRGRRGAGRELRLHANNYVTYANVGSDLGQVEGDEERALEIVGHHCQTTVRPDVLNRLSCYAMICIIVQPSPPQQRGAAPPTRCVRSCEKGSRVAGSGTESVGDSEFWSTIDDEKYAKNTFGVSLPH